ncbi:hypothetical protein PAHAL_4G243400 [Panicum hallii]|uniref:Uncharacterized protein n=1 Tax=Panicum hallii TaxID=206008 RepID=A0A2S3HJT8_9POAL|nr:hypothetical protein PAHAL_4G243400 [Panicum hallii]
MGSFTSCLDDATTTICITISTVFDTQNGAKHDNRVHCNYGAILQITHQQQLLFTFNPMAMAMSRFFFKQPFVGVPFWIDDLILNR